MPQDVDRSGASAIPYSLYWAHNQANVTDSVVSLRHCDTIRLAHCAFALGCFRANESTWSCIPWAYVQAFTSICIDSKM